VSEQTPKKPVILSGIQPSGDLCIGNYLGALRNWVDMQDEYDCIYLLVDLHALTVQQVPAELRKRCLSFIAQYIACGIDPEKSTVAIQSHISAHAELAWVLGTMTYMGELNRMTQFKDKSAQHQANINSGLFTYPVLMAADILLYQADCVPVGADQKQHLELARDVAQRFNQRYSETFVIPEAFIPKAGARIMSLQEPEKKMSKSDANPQNYVALLDAPEIVLKKLKRAVTDSGSDIRYDEARPGLANLLTMYSVMTGQDMAAVHTHFEGKLYGALKAELADVMIETLRPIQTRYAEITKDKRYLEDVLAQGADEARKRARKTLSKVYRKIGFVQPAR
jgi:tryptophanyl-tRNA synthetase